MPYLVAVATILPMSSRLSGTGGAVKSCASSPISSKNRSCNPPGVWLTSILPGLPPTFL